MKMLDLKFFPLLYGAVNAQSGDGNFDPITDGKISSFFYENEFNSYRLRKVKSGRS